MRKPKITFPELVAQEVEKYYEMADIILEYGSGGSTYLAAKLDGKVIYSVESDASWLCNLGLQIRSSDPRSHPYLYYVDIGNTKEWGHPADDAKYRNWPNYSNAIWREEFFEQPDVVLIDGRFRKACFLATLGNCKKDMVVLFDDYGERKNYHDVERFVTPVKFIERMAVFEISPGLVDAEAALHCAEWLYNPA
ncbi:hypothetical protein [Saccharospirillum sp.]|uniref:hypothetical protein n=1 Tax=Saccharospirillum sp. TaxID=2033801 RepID=UPI00349FD401